jgi:hypothetical protein
MAAEAQAAHAVKNASLQEYAAMTQTAQLQDAVIKAYPEVRWGTPNVPADLERLRASNPQRYKQLMAADAAVAQKGQQLQALAQQRALVENQVAQHQRAQQEHALRTLKVQHDAAFDQIAEKIDPKWSDKAHRIEVQQTIMKSLEATVHPEVVAAIKAGRHPLLVGEQVHLLKSAMWDLAQERARAIRAKPLPPVQKPGMSRPTGADAVDDIRDLQNQLKTAKGHKAIAIAAKLTAAKRATRGD